MLLSNRFKLLKRCQLAYRNPELKYVAVVGVVMFDTLLI